MTNPTLTEDPRLTNMFGPVDAKIRVRLRQVLSKPRRYWDRDHGLILRNRPHLTLWQAIIAIDRTFPRTGRVTDSQGRIVEDWRRYPDSVLVGRAIKHALTATKEPK